MTAPTCLPELRSLAALHPDRDGVALCAWAHLHDLLEYVAELEAEAEIPGAAHGERG